MYDGQIILEKTHVGHTVYFWLDKQLMWGTVSAKPKTHYIYNSTGSYVDFLEVTLHNKSKREIRRIPSNKLYNSPYQLSYFNRTIINIIKQDNYFILKDITFDFGSNKLDNYIKEDHKYMVLCGERIIDKIANSIYGQSSNYIRPHTYDYNNIIFQSVSCISNTGLICENNIYFNMLYKVRDFLYSDCMSEKLIGDILQKEIKSLKNESLSLKI